jgi:hypothetical protein
VNTFTVAEPSRYFVDYFDENPFTFDIQNHWMELVPHDMYVAPDGDDSNSGLSAQEPLRTIAWAVRKVYADSLQPRTVHVAAGTYSHQGNGQIYPIGCKNYVSIIGEDMENTFLFNDYAQTSFASIHTDNIQLSNFTLRHSEDKFSQYVIYIYKTDVTVLKNLDISYNTNIRGIITNEFINNTQYDNLTIKNNISYYDTPGLLLSRNSGYLRNSVIEGNIYIVPDSLDDCSSVSTAMHLGTPDNFTVENCVFRNNSSPSDPWVNWNQIIRVRNNNNTEASITFNNCLIADNTTASDWVFRIFNYDGTTEFNNCTFANNTADPSYSHNTTLNAWGDTNITNTIMHDNTAYEVFVQDDTQYDYIYKLNVKNSNIKGGIDGIYNQNGVNTITWGEGNMMWDPQFVGTGENPYQLSFNSLCIDAGTPDTTGMQLPSADLLGNERIWDGDEDGIAVIDMGCYEYGAPEVDNDPNDIPQLVENYLSNYPNPFNPSTTINFSLPQTGFVKISVYNSKGRRVRLLVNDYYAAGKHTAQWKGRDDKGNELASGVYFYRLQVDGKTRATRKCLLLK